MRMAVNVGFEGNSGVKSKKTRSYKDKAIVLYLIQNNIHMYALNIGLLYMYVYSNN